MRKVFRGNQALQPAQEKRARPIQLKQLRHVDQWLDIAAARGFAAGDTPMQLRHVRDRTLRLLGFWRSFRGDGLTRLRIEFVKVVAEEGMTCYLPQTKGDSTQLGSSFKTPVMEALCPVAAYTAWITLAGIEDGPVSRSIDRWGNLACSALHNNSLVPLLRAIFGDAGIEFAEQFSGHFFRRGFAQWANSNGWDINTLMRYVGWKNMQSSMRYIDGPDPFSAGRRIREPSAGRQDL